MLDNYLRRGVRLKWMPPKSVTSNNDGTVIPTPHVALNPLVYDGMDDQIMANFHAGALGLRVGQTIPYQWLTYVSGRTTTMPIGGGDILTGPMSGCMLATWTDGGQKFAHVGTIDNNVPASQLVKRTFAAHAGAAGDLCAFSPSSVWTPNEVAGAMGARPMAFQIYGLLTGGAHYAVLVFEIPAAQGGPGYLAGNSFLRVVGGIKPVPTIQGVRLRAFLMS